MKSFATCGLALVLAAAMSHSGALRAEVSDKLLAEMYSQGLKSFYSGQYAQAHDMLSQAIDGGTKDPRPYYIRGIANSRLGRTANAKSDFEKGAALEGKDFDVFYNVSTALERIQGGERRMLESYRTAGRKNALAEVEKIRFEHFRRFDPAEGVAGAATTSSGTGMAAGAPPATGATTDPSAMPATGAAPANPFGAPAAPAGAPNNPFGTPAAPATTPPAATPPGANPFGT